MTRPDPTATSVQLPRVRALTHRAVRREACSLSRLRPRRRGSTGGGRSYDDLPPTRSARRRWRRSGGAQRASLLSSGLLGLLRLLRGAFLLEGLLRFLLGTLLCVLILRLRHGQSPLWCCLATWLRHRPRIPPSRLETQALRTPLPRASRLHAEETSRRRQLPRARNGGPRGPGWCDRRRPRRHPPSRHRDSSDDRPVRGSPTSVDMPWPESTGRGVG